jgi:hypothetical protein
MGNGYLYAVLFSNGLIKVGRAKTPAVRIGQHRMRLAVAGIKIDKTCTQPCSSSAVVAEAFLIEKCVAQALQTSGNEWFVGLQFETVCAWLAQACALETPIKPDYRFVCNPAGLRIGPYGSYVCRSCSRFHDSDKCNSVFLCIDCLAAGYVFIEEVGQKQRATLTLHGEPVPFWHASVNAPDASPYPGVTCEELRPGLPWLRVEDFESVMGRPTLEYGATRRVAERRAAAQAEQGA